MDKFRSSYRFTVFVPQESMDGFIKAIQDHIPSFLGSYDRVLWFSDLNAELGVEQYRALATHDNDNSKEPPDKTQQKPSCKVEFSFPADDKICQNFIEDVVKPNHPWDEPVILLNKSYIYDAAA